MALSLCPFNPIERFFLSTILPNTTSAFFSKVVAPVHCEMSVDGISLVVVEWSVG